MRTHSPFLNNFQQVLHQVYFSPGDACLGAILSLVNAAQHSLKICVFTISDDRISEAILTAHREGVRVQLITDNDKLFDTGSDIRQLAAAGIEVRVDFTSNHMHHKFAIADTQAVLTGSYNWTRSAARFNHENVLVTNHRATVFAYLNEFEKLWPEMERL
ncbi:phospholipase D-like domain-containing protein [Pontibacter sp. SGAir0037]|uniref:phospholipase D-like domain-containing protein n=1 Tax=Pontibacter sp. SGAir0037 TaxID=2571030 RepID=UPI0010CD3359|nr:phospholipase D-like domain-containing protein [Pontibacter sp. SGAir0037]QCR21458.1 endonuclease [Pontibacter sp. SGAir0037]